MRLKRHINFINELKNEPKEIVDMVENDLLKAGFDIVNVFHVEGMDEDYLERLKDDMVGYQESGRDTFFELLFINDPGYEKLREFMNQVIPGSMVYKKVQHGQGFESDFVLAFNMKKLLKSDFIKSKRGINKYNL
jgi:hypothetical protein